MSHWNETIILVSRTETWQDEEGAVHEGGRVERKVFCNPGILGVMTMSQLRSSEVRITGSDDVPDVGMREMSMVYVRQCDYRGESQVIYRGKEMDVIALTSEHDSYKMILRQRLGNND